MGAKGKDKMFITYPSCRIYNPAVLNTEFVIRLRFAFKMLILTVAGLQIRQDGS
jgi:hypothetical protein